MLENMDSMKNLMTSGRCSTCDAVTFITLVTQFCIFLSGKGCDCFVFPTPAVGSVTGYYGSLDHHVLFLAHRDWTRFGGNWAMNLTESGFHEMIISAPIFENLKGMPLDVYNSFFPC